MILLIVSLSIETHRQFDSIFSEFGFQLHHAYSADDASQVLKTNSRINIAILDSSLGDTQLRPLILRFGLAGAPVARCSLILYHPVHEQLLQSRYIEWGCHQFLIEPLAQEKIMALVQQACPWKYKKLLLLADHQDLVSSLKDLFSQDACALHQVSNVHDLHEAVDSAAFHLLIAEEHLFGRNAHEILHALRELPLHIPLILLTDYAQAKSNWPSGVDLVLTKPVNLTALHERVRELLAIYRMPQVYPPIATGE